MSNTTTQDIATLQNLISELGIQATTVRELDEGNILIDWNGEEETYTSAETAEKEIRQAAE